MNKYVGYPFVVVTIVLFVVLFYKVAALQEQVEGGISPEKPEQEQHEEEEVEVADIMMKLQRHSTKLGLAGQQQNWELAHFYTVEVEEAMEAITKQKVVEEGVNLTELMKMMGEKPLEKVREAIKSQDTAAFQKQYKTLIRSCNDCHRSAKHEFIRVQVPETPLYQYQDFSPHK